MSNYYGGQPHLRNELYHSGKKGMRWGISNNPLYKAVGNLAKGVLRNGRYVYDNVAGYVNKTASDIRSGQAQRNVRNWAGNLWDGQAGRGTGRSVALGLAKKGGRAYQNKDYESGNRYANAAKEAERRYSNSIVGRANSAANSLRKTATSAGNWLSDRGSELRKSTKNARNALGTLWDGQAGRGTAKDNAKQYAQYAIRARKNGDIKGAKKWEEAARRAGEAHNNSIRGKAEVLGNRVSSAFKSAGKTIGKHAKNATDWADSRRKEAADFIDTITGNKKRRAQATVNADQERGKKRTQKQNDDNWYKGKMTAVDNMYKNGSTAKKAKMRENEITKDTTNWANQQNNLKYLPDWHPAKPKKSKKKSGSSKA